MHCLCTWGTFFPSPDYDHLNGIRLRYGFIFGFNQLKTAQGLPSPFLNSLQQEKVVAGVHKERKVISGFSKINERATHLNNAFSLLGEKMVKKASIFVATFALLIVAGCGGSDGSSIKSGSDALTAMKNGVESGIDDLISDAQPHVDNFISLPLSGTDADQELAELADIPQIIDALTLDDKAVVKAIQPAKYNSLIGELLNDQAHIEMMRGLSTPLLSNFFLALDGVPSIAMEFPLHSSGSIYKGSVSLLIDHVNWFGEIANSTLGGTPYGVDLIQLDGVMLWNADSNLIGKNVFTDPSFQHNSDFIRQVHETVGMEQGSGNYTWSPDATTSVKQSCVWSTIKRANAEWRLMVWWAQ